MERGEFMIFLCHYLEVPPLDLYMCEMFSYLSISLQSLKVYQLRILDDGILISFDSYI